MLLKQQLKLPAVPTCLGQRPTPTCNPSGRRQADRAGEYYGKKQARTILHNTVRHMSFPMYTKSHSRSQTRNSTDTKHQPQASRDKRPSCPSRPRRREEENHLAPRPRREKSPHREGDKAQSTPRPSSPSRPGRKQMTEVRQQGLYEPHRAHRSPTSWPVASRTLGSRRLARYAHFYWSVLHSTNRRIQ